MAKTIQFGEQAVPRNPQCMVCEELLADALDGILSAGDQAFFDGHIAACTACMDAYAQAHRGVVWLSMLKNPRPEPSELLVERILAQTSGVRSSVANDILESTQRVAAGAIPLPENVLPFVSRPMAASRFSRLAQLATEPRYAMTAAMAFFSIALTLNLLGVRLDQLHAADLNPSNLKRTYYEANASAVRYCDNLRVVRVVEARVEDIRQAKEGDAAPKQVAPESPDTERPEQKPKQEKPQGSSRRESPLPQDRLLEVSSASVAERVRHGAVGAALTLRNAPAKGGLA